MQCCLRLLNEGTFGSTMKSNITAISALFDGKATTGTDYFNIFCQLKVYFLQHVKKCPDLYDATLETDVQAISCPPNPGPEGGSFTPTENAFCALFTCVLRYLNDCILGQLIFSCPAPSNSGEVILGTVEIKNGKLTRVCHCVRKYVWSAANFWQVLVTTILEKAACETPHYIRRNPDQVAGSLENAPSPTEPAPVREVKQGCCPDYSVNCRTFVALYEASPASMQTNVTAPLNLIRSLTAGLQTALNLFDPNAVSPSVFNGLDPNAATILAQKANMNLQMLQVAPVPMAGTPLREAFVNLLARPGDQITAVLDQYGKIQVVPLTTVQSSLGTHPGAGEPLSTELQQRDQTIAELQAALAGLSDRIAKLESKGGN
jgi:hypothetical protein